MADSSADTRNAAERMLDADKASRALGIELAELSEGRAVMTMAVTDLMVNGHDIAHGGYVFLLADTAFACACNSHGPVTVAAGAEVSFVASARLGDVLVATAEERTRFGRNGIYDVTVRRASSDDGADGTGGTDGADGAGGAGGAGGAEGAGGTVIAEFRGRSRTIERNGEA